MRAVAEAEKVRCEIGYTALTSLQRVRSTHCTLVAVLQLASALRFSLRGDSDFGRPWCCSFGYYEVGTYYSVEAVLAAAATWLADLALHHRVVASAASSSRTRGGRVRRQQRRHYHIHH